MNYRLTLLMIFLSTFLSGQSLVKIDSIRGQPLTAANLEAYFAENINFLMRGLPEADSITMIGLEMAKELDDPGFLARYYGVLAIGAHNDDLPRKSDSLLDLSAVYSLQAKDTSQYYYTQIERLGGMTNAGNYGAAMQRGLALIPEIEAFNDSSLLVVLMYEIALASSHTEDYERNLTYTDRAKKYASEYPVQGMEYLDNILMLHAANLVKLGYPEQALSNYDEAIATSKDSDANVQYLSLLRRADLRRQRDDMGGAREDLDAAFLLEPNFEYYLYNGIWLQQAGRFREARQSLHRALALSGTDGRDNGKLKAEAYKYLQHHNLNAAQYDTARYYGNLLTKALDQATRQTNANLVKDLEVQYETREKEEQIATQGDLLAQQRQTQRLTYGILGLAALGIIGLFFGLRSNRRKSELLSARNDQNELLLKEIHHRVKNNLETVSSLLELQSATLTDEHALAAMQAGQSRVHSMGLLHQKLYQGKNLAAIEMKDYFANLAAGLLETYEVEDHITVDVNMPETELDVDTAVPLSLIVNELLTNAIKYAFSGADAGAIKIGLSSVGNGGYRLTVEDNGVGKDFTAGPRGTGFGTRLVSLLTRQLGGELTETNNGGLRTELAFSHQ